MRPALVLCHRELQQHLRSVAPYAWRLVILCVLFVMVAETGHGRVGNGHQAFLMLFFLNLVVIAISGPLLFANTITEEREAQTLELLLLTRLGPGAIVAGKLASRGLGAMILLLVQLPVGMLAVTFGGVAAADIMHTYGVLLLYLFFVANLGVAMSALSRRTRQAGVLTAGVLLIHGISGTLLIKLGQVLGPPGSGTLSSFCHWLGDLAMKATYNGNLMQVTVTPLNASAHLLGGIVCFAIACAGLSIRSKSRGREKQPKARTQARRRYPWVWPHAWKDCVLVAGGARAYLWKIILFAGLFGVVSAYLDATDQLTGYSLGMTLLPILSLSIVLEISWLLSTSLFSEVQKNTLASLATIPGSLHGIALQKVFGALLGAVPGVIAWGLAMLLSGEMDLREILRNLPEFGSVLGIGLFYAHAVVFFSLWIGRASPVAAAGAVILGGTLFAFFFRPTEETFYLMGLTFFLTCIPLHLRTVDRLRFLAGR